MANIATQTIGLAGVGPTYSACAGGGDTFTPDARTFLHVKNTGGSPLTVTVVTPGTVRGSLAVGDVAVSVPATTGDRMIGPFDPSDFADPAQSGLTSITYSGVTGLTIAVLQLTQPSR